MVVCYYSAEQVQQGYAGLCRVSVARCVTGNHNANDNTGYEIVWQCD